MVLAPVVRGRKGEYGKLFEELRERGLHAREGRRRAAPARGGDRPRQEVQARHLGRDRPARDAAGPAQAAGGLDRDRRGARRGAGRRRARRHGRGRPPTSDRFTCLHCGTSMPELEPRMFSFNSPHGACPRCTGLGSQMEIDPELIVPDPSLSLNEGAILPWSTSASNYYEQMTSGDRRQVGGRHGHALGGPPGGRAQLLPVRHERRADLRLVPQPLRAPALVHDDLRGDRAATSSAATARPTRTGRARRSRST